jgi:predicted transcriptional regulator
MNSTTTPIPAQFDAQTPACAAAEAAKSVQRNLEADAAWQHYQDTGLHIDGRETIAWLRSLSTPNPLAKPQARCEK